MTTSVYSREKFWQTFWIIAYFAIILLVPYIFLNLAHHSSHDHSALLQVGRYLGLMGITTITLQFVLTARIKKISKYFALNNIYRFHGVVGSIALISLISHPFFIAASSSNWALLYSLDWPWHIILAKTTLTILLIHVILAHLKLKIFSNFELWRFVHNIAPLILLMGATHALFTAKIFANV